LTCYTWHLILDIWHWHLTCYTWHLILDTWYLTLALDMLYLTPDTWHLISDTGTWYVILDTWSTTLDIWHRYLTCYHLTPDTWHLIYDTWQMTCYHLLDMLSHGTSTLDLILWHRLVIVIPDTCITLHIHDYHFYRDLAWYYTVTKPLLFLNSCAPEFLYPWTPVTGRLLTLCSWCYTPVDPCNWIIIYIGLLWTPCGHYLWAI